MLVLVVPRKLKVPAIVHKVLTNPGLLILLNMESYTNAGSSTIAMTILLPVLLSATLLLT